MLHAPLRGSQLISCFGRFPHDLKSDLRALAMSPSPKAYACALQMNDVSAAGLSQLHATSEGISGLT